MRGRDKLLEPAPKTPLLRQISSEAVATGAPVFVALPENAPRRRALIHDLPLTTVPVKAADRSMSQSLRQGFAALPHADWAMILLSDLPLIRREHLDIMAMAARSSRAEAIRACAADGTPGHPVMLAHRIWPRINDLRGDRGAQALLSGQQVDHVALPGSVATTDLDTPEAWDAWRKELSQP